MTSNNHQVGRFLVRLKSVTIDKEIIIIYARMLILSEYLSDKKRFIKFTSSTVLFAN